MFIQPLGEGAGTANGGTVIPPWLPWALVGVGGAVLAVVLLMVLRGGRAGKRSDDGHEHRQSAAELADLKSQLLEVKRLAATVADDLDRRAERLERLIAQADELLEGTERETYTSSNTSPGGLTRGERLRSAPAPAAPSPTDDLAQRVFMLADEGRSAVQIAQVLRQPVGNVELMLALRGGR